MNRNALKSEQRKDRTQLNSAKSKDQTKSLKPAVHVLIPAYKTKYTFNTEKNTSWGAIDKVFMHSICQSAQTIEELVEASNLPRSLVLEIIIPFIREGWIHIKTDGDNVRFEVTERGKLINRDPIQLPPKTVPHQTAKHFLILQPTNLCMLHPKTWTKDGFNEVLSEKGCQKFYRDYPHVTRLNVVNYKDGKNNLSWTDIYRTLFSGDEEVLSLKSNDTPLMSDILSRRNLRYLVAMVSPNDEITGIPNLIKDSLKDEILNAAVKYRHELPEASTSTNLLTPHVMDIQLRVDDYPELYVEPNQVQLVMGPEDHERVFFDAIDQTQSWLIIHSTFINFAEPPIPSRLQEVKQRIYALLKSKQHVRVDIFWGLKPTDTPDEEENPLDQTKDPRVAFLNWKNEVESLGLSNRLFLHLQSTESHAKFLICDHELFGPTVTIGSCNWLSTGFHRHETSVSISHSAACVEVLTLLGRIIERNSGMAKEPSQTLARWASKLSKYSKSILTDEEKMALIRVRFVNPSQHYNTLLVAREDVQYRLALCSHRVAKVGTQTVLDTLTALKKDKPSVAVTVYYSKREEDLKGLTEPLEGKCQNAGIELRKLKSLHAHSKFVCWDDDNVMITSQNWLSVQLSAMTREREFGVLLNGRGLATQLFDSIESFADAVVPKKK